MKDDLLYHFFTDDDLLRISNKIKEIEKQTAGEICISIKEKKSLFQKNKRVKQLAEKEFNRLGISNTKEKTGLLFYMLLEEREFIILADSGITSKVFPETFESIKSGMQEYFIKGKFCEGILFGLKNLGEVLAENFPLNENDTNEISNKVIIK